MRADPARSHKLEEGRDAVRDMVEGGATSPSLAPTAFDWQRWQGSAFDVDFAVSGDDVIYQFWPPEGLLDFPGGWVATSTGQVPAFSMTADKVFGGFLPGDAVVRAEVIDVKEQQAVARIEGREQRLVRPHQVDISAEELALLPYRPTLYVKVEGQLQNPVGHHILLSRIFVELDKAHPET
jgi:hypothetical protein